ncbi:hypothetical protein [Oceanobacillus oncorhynchi]|uniref:hypothetical protein n=1 Tax=Oceanobacillus oncorhynchi TaxID=545501 RepID=UPI0025A45099|nr:hypothetical protein [Oceanobacillus oncorhynchi]MDM8100962.1 hypothetical protein [Oceanobacillus oncorhynchi]
MLSKDAIHYLMQSGIQPDERHIEFTDSDGILRDFIINDDGEPKEIRPVVNTAHNILRLNSLTGLVEYIKSKLERENEPLFLHVEDERSVSLQSTLLADGSREMLVSVGAIVPSFRYEHYYDVEEMLINFQSKFRKTEDRDLLLKVVGNVQEENVRQTGDTGVAQAVTIKTGISNADDVVVPNPVTLAPYRTFLEVEQPESDFIFRMKEGPRGAIFEADGGAWRNTAIANVRDYLAEQLATELTEGRITILA